MTDTTNTTMREAFGSAAIRAVDAGRAKEPTVTMVVRSVLAGVGKVRRHKWWSVARDRG
jgi:hypothetical protein